VRSWTNARFSARYGHDLARDRSIGHPVPDQPKQAIDGTRSLAKGSLGSLVQHP